MKSWTEPELVAQLKQLGITPRTGRNFADARISKRK